MTLLPDSRRFVIKRFGRYGLIDVLGRIVVEPGFQFLGDYREGFVSFRVGKLYGFIDSQGTVLVEPKFQDSKATGPTFSFGLSVLGLAGEKGYIDGQGNVKIGGALYFATGFKAGFAIVQRVEGQRAFEIIDQEGDTVSDFAAAEVPDIPDWPLDWNSFGCFVSVEHRWLVGLFNRRGECWFKPKYPQMSEFYAGVAGYCLFEDSARHPFGLVDVQGTQIRSPIYYNLSGFSEGLAGAGRSLREHGFIDASGEWVIEPKYKQALPFSGGLACVTVDGRKGFINPKGEMVIEPRFDRQASFRDGLALVEYEGKRAYIDESGRIVWETRLEDE